MDNKPTTTFLGKYKPRIPIRPSIITNTYYYEDNEPMYYCLIATCNENCEECLFDESNKKEFNVWLINKRLLSL